MLKLILFFSFMVLQWEKEALYRSLKQPTVVIVSFYHGSKKSRKPCLLSKGHKPLIHRSGNALGYGLPLDAW